MLVGIAGNKKKKKKKMGLDKKEKSQNYAFFDYQVSAIVACIGTLFALIS